MSSRHTGFSRGGGVHPPRLSDEAVVEIYLILDDLFELFESTYGEQIDRHFDALFHRNAVEPDVDWPHDDLPF